MLGPRRLVQEKLRFGEDGFLAGDEDEPADLVRNGGAAGLAGDEVETPFAARWAERRRICVVLPEPSIPSKVTKMPFVSTRRSRRSGT